MDNKPRILVIEDEKPIRNFMCVSLETQGYKCIDTQHGKTAVSLVSAHNPDIIIIDLGLPHIDGIDVIAMVRPLTKAAIIVVSARGLINLYWMKFGVHFRGTIRNHFGSLWRISAEKSKRNLLSRDIF